MGTVMLLGVVEGVNKLGPRPPFSRVVGSTAKNVVAIGVKEVAAVLLPVKSLFD